MLEVEYYRKENGRYPIRDFINQLDVKLQSKIQIHLMMLASAGSELRMPYSRYLLNGIYELRISRDGITIRLLYFFAEGKAVLTNGFIKKTKTTPFVHIKTARTRRDKYMGKRLRP